MLAVASKYVCIYKLERASEREFYFFYPFLVVVVVFATFAWLGSESTNTTTFFITIIFITNRQAIFVIQTYIQRERQSEIVHIVSYCYDEAGEKKKRILVYAVCFGHIALTNNHVYFMWWKWLICSATDSQRPSSSSSVRPNACVQLIFLAFAQ